MIFKTKWSWNICIYLIQAPQGVSKPPPRCLLHLLSFILIFIKIIKPQRKQQIWVGLVQQDSRSTKEGILYICSFPKKCKKKSEIHPNITRAYIKKLHCSWTPYKRIVFSFQYNAPTYGYRKNSIVSNNKKTVVFQKQLFFVWCVFTTQKHWYFLKSEAIIHNRWSHWRQLKQRGVSLQGFRTTRFLPQHLKSER